MKNIERKDDHPVFGKVHLQPQSIEGKLPVIDVSIAYQKYPLASCVIGISVGIQIILRIKPVTQIILKRTIVFLK